MYINNDLNYMEWLKDKNLIVFGFGKDGIDAYKKLKKHSFRIIAFVDNDVRKQGECYDGVNILSFEKAEQLTENNKVYVIASRKFENEIREQLMNQSNEKFISIEQIDFSCNDIDYYDEDYFQYQGSIGKIGSEFDFNWFKDFISKEEVVVEFGSGGGWLLKLIDAKEKIGIEINDYARKNAADMGIKSVKYMEELPDEYADVIISTHALEHVDDPLNILKGLKKKLKKNGKMIFIVPYQSSSYEYEKNNIDNEFWNWNCLTLGNLFKRAGFFVMRVERIMNQLPPQYVEIFNNIGIETVECLSLLYSDYIGSESIRIVAK